MKSVKIALLALSMVSVMGMATSAAAQAGSSSHEYMSSYFTQMRPMVAKMSVSEKQTAVDMEMAIMKMEMTHQMAMTKAKAELQMAIIKMRQEYERYIFSKGSF